MPGTFLGRDLLALQSEGVTFDLHVFALDDSDPDFRHEVEEHGGRIVPIDYPISGRIALTLLRALFTQPIKLLGSLCLAVRTLFVSPAEGIRALAVLPASLELGRKLYQSSAPQVHALWAGTPASVAYWIWRHYRIPYGLSGHAWDITGWTHLLPRKVAASQGMAVCSEFALRTTREKLDPSLHDRVHLVHHGLDLEHWLSGSRDPGAARPSPAQLPFRIIAVGRLHPKKGFEYLVRACGLLKDSDLDFRCEIIGPDAGSGALLAKLVDELGLSDVVSLPGGMTRAEVKDRMAVADVLVCPSVRLESGASDGIPNVILEAMALGVPVVATDAGGVSEVVIDGRTGVSVPQKDTGKLADAISRIYSDPAACESRIAAAQQLLRDSFDSRKNARAFLEAIGLRSA